MADNCITVSIIKKSVTVTITPQKHVTAIFAKKSGESGPPGPPGPEGPQGPQGDQGAQGIPGNDGQDGMDGANGMDGADGTDGADGSQIFTASGVPSGSLGVDSDFYINTDNGDYYQKESGAWVLKGNLTGPQGIQGIQGLQGDPGQDGQDGADGIDGTDGTDGATWFDDNGLPSAGLGNDGDYYLDNLTGDIYNKQTGSWVVIANIEGPQGIQGPAGQDGADGQDGTDGQDGADGNIGWAWTIERPVNKRYVIDVETEYSGTIDTSITRSVSGTCTMTFDIDGTPLGGTANSVSSTKDTEAHSSANAFAVGTEIGVTVSANSQCKDASFTIHVTPD